MIIQQIIHRCLIPTLARLQEGAPGENPWMRNISDYLVDEASAEEDELLGGVTNAEKKVAEESAPVDITRDDQLIKVLDRLLYYLRIVHSVDYYNATEYPCEDEMPNRLVGVLCVCVVINCACLFCTTRLKFLLLLFSHVHE